MLTHQIESGLWQREGKTVSNFNSTLPTVQSDLAQQTLKDPYVFDFLPLTSIVPGFTSVIPALSSVIPALSSVIPALSSVIPAKAGIHRGFLHA